MRVVEYIYDAWGKLISTTGTLATTLGADNPFRYRGYYYDTETGLYYLTTRYYDPEVCRFISADVYMSTGQGVLGGNMWAYCGNNPVAMVDSNGQETNWNTLFGGIELLLVAAVGFASVATVLSGGCAAPLLVLTIAAMTASAATVSAACGTAEVVEAFTDHNFIRDTLLNPGKHIPDKASAINNITDDMVADAPAFMQIIDSLNAFVGKSNIVGHNLPFDLKFLYRYGYDFTANKRRYYDTCEIAKKTLKKPKLKWDKDFDEYVIDYDCDYDVEDYKLTTLCDYYQIRDNMFAHRALSDALATGELFKCLAKDRIGI